MYKQNTHEGGMHEPMIICYPELIKDEGGIREQYTHAIDVVPTVLEVLGLQASEIYNGYAQKPIEGVSFAGSLADPYAENGKHVQYYEMFLSVLELLNIFPLHSEIDQLRKSPYMICDSCRHHGRPMHPFSSVLVYSSHQTFMRLNEMRYSEIDI